MPTGVYVRTDKHKEVLSKNGFKKGYTPYNKGQKLSDEHRRKISENNGRGFLGKHHTAENNEKNRLAHLGKKASEVTKMKMRERKGEKCPSWKGDKVGYPGIHEWVRKELGKPDTCEFCGRTGLSGRKINWANKSGRYLRDLNDWLRLCIPCHRKYDKQFNH